MPGLLYLYNYRVADTISALDADRVASYPLEVFRAPSISIDRVATKLYEDAVMQVDAVSLYLKALLILYLCTLYLNRLHLRATAKAKHQYKNKYKG